VVGRFSKKRKKRLEMTSLKDKDVSTRSMMDRLDETLKMLKHNFHNPLSTEDVRHHEDSGKNKSFMEEGSDSSTISGGGGGDKKVSGASVVGVVSSRGGGGGGIYRFVSPMRYPLFSARYKFLHHYLFRCLVMFIFLVMVMGVFEWSIRRKLGSGTMGSRNNRNDRQVVRTWKKFWIEMVWKALLVTVIINVILFVYLDLQTIP
jgi:hypothetical protein